MENEEKYILLKNFFNPSEELLDIIKNKDKYNYSPGMVGHSIDLQRKRRMDYFLNEERIIKELDDKIFYELNNLIKEKFNFDIKYREIYKIGHYSSKDNGYYNSHTDKQGGMDYRNISIVVCLSKKEEYEGGEFILNTLGNIFKLDFGDVLLFRSELIHNVIPVYSGDRYVIISFMFDELHYLYFKTVLNTRKNDLNNYDSYNKIFPYNINNKINPKKYLYNILINSGPGNQVISIKEAYVIAKLTNRKLILPKILPHYTLQIQNNFIEFNKIYNIRDDDIISFEDSESCELLNEINTIYCFNRYTLNNNHEKYIEKYIKKSEIKQTDIMLNYNFKKIQDFDILYKKDDKVLCIKNVFNTVLFNECPINNAFDSKLNFNLYKIYQYVCSKFDFSDYIKEIGDKYILENFGENPFISLHLRYPDNHMFKSISNYLNYNEKDINDKLIELCNKYEIATNNIFIATNSIYNCRSTELYSNKFIDSLTDIPTEYLSFIEQYICSKSTIFLMSKYNDYTKINKPHQRSTWSSFVRDYRLYVLRKKLDTNLILDDLFELNKSSLLM